MAFSLPALFILMLSISIIITNLYYIFTLDSTDPDKKTKEIVGWSMVAFGAIVSIISVFYMIKSK